jgi:hypothetical protein
MTKWLLACWIFLAPAATAQTVRDANGDLIMRLSRIDGRTVAHDSAGNLLGSWKKEGDFIVHRGPNGDVLTRTGR